MTSTRHPRLIVNVDALRSEQPPHDPTGLGPHASAVVTAVAVLGPKAPLRDTAELAGLTLDETLAAVDRLFSAGVLVGSVPLSFQDQNAAERVLAELPMGTRITARLRAAEILRRYPGNAERVARQLVEVGATGLDWAGKVCDEAATAAIAERGDHRAAADYLCHALSEPMTSPDRAAAVFRLADLLADTEPLPALTLVLRELRDQDTCAEATTVGAMLIRLAARLRDNPVATRRVDEATGLLIALDREAAARVVVAGAAMAVFRPGAAGRLTELERLLVAANVSSARHGLLAVRACLRALLAPRAGGAVDLAATVLAEADPGHEEDARWLALCALLLAGDDTAAEQACRQITLEGGSLRCWLGAELVLVHSMRKRGRLPEAVRAAESLLTRCVELGLRDDHRVVVTAAACLAEALVHGGDAQRAGLVLAQYGLDKGETAPATAMWVLRARGAVSAAHGQWEEALADLLKCGRQVAAWSRLTADFVPWRFEAVVTALRAGRQEEALALAQADIIAARIRDTPRARGFAAYAHGLCTQGSQQAELLTEAAELLHEAGSTLAEARALHDLSTALLGLDRAAEAESVLARADELTRVCGAGRPGAWFSEAVAVDRPVLTPQERRIVRLVVLGRSNLEIAAELRLARRTVEFHLSGVYRKLGVRGRRELAEMSGADAD
ncbi:LuxR C-terminal-related transcriptional regulator [Lentzea sp. NPDC051213]|uniref:LuxR C-terminal-related transcriptional regulator n=1 Tax=Lentzea sp. NPDC051213 TaxID=3364126 RepID=UPI0037AE5646